MKKRLHTKYSLIVSIASIILCFAMLVGTTFAWFTETVTTGDNLIVAGNLDVALYYKTAWDMDAEWQPVTSETKLFDPNALWEPGHTQVVYLKVVNEGTLALKYNMDVNILSETAGINKAGETFMLSDYIKAGGLAMGAAEWGWTAEEMMNVTIGNADRADMAKYAEYGLKEGIVVDGTPGSNERVGSTVLNPGEENIAFVVVHMPTSVENEANYKTGTNPPTIKLGFNLVATQHVKEEDSFGNDYDADAALTTVNLSGKTDYTQAYAMVSDTIVTVNGNGNTISGTANRLFNFDGVENATLVLNNVVLDGSDSTGTYTRGINVFNSKNVKIVLNNVVIKNVGWYALNVASQNEGVEIEINDSTIQGYAALNVWSKADITVNNSTLTGLNSYIGSSNNFAAIVFNEGAEGTVLNMNNTTVNALKANVNCAEEDTIDNRIEGQVTINKADVTYNKGTMVSSAEEINNIIGNGITADTYIDGMGADLGVWDYDADKIPSGVTLTVANANFNGKSYGNGVDGTIVFENCTFTNTGAYSIHFDNGTGNVVFNNCDISGWNSFGSTIDSVTFNHCNISGNGSYALVRVYQDAVMNYCTIDCTNTNTSDIYPDGVSAVNGATLTLNDCVIAPDVTYEVAENAKIVVDGVVVKE